MNGFRSNSRRGRSLAEGMRASVHGPLRAHYVTKHLQQGIESDHFRVKQPMPQVGGFRSFNTARRSIQGFEAMLWVHKGFGFAGTWTVVEQNRMLGFCFGLSGVNEA